MSDLAELLATVEQVRSEHYSHLPADLVAQVLRIEAEHTDDPVGVVRELRRLIKQRVRGSDAEA
jgi:hypothetical protein